MNHKELTKSRDFDREALVLSLKKRIRKGVSIPLTEAEPKAKNKEGYRQIKDFRKLSDKKALLWFEISYKLDPSGEDIRDIKVFVRELWARSNVFIPVDIGANNKQELSSLIKKHIKIDKDMKESF